MTPTQRVFDSLNIGFSTMDRLSLDKMGTPKRMMDGDLGISVLVELLAVGCWQ